MTKPEYIQFLMPETLAPTPGYTQVLKLPQINRRGSSVVPTLPPLREALVEDLKTCKPMNSDGQNMSVSKQDARLSFIITLASDLRPFPGGAFE
jgi:hypothetical protein